MGSVLRVPSLFLYVQMGEESIINRDASTIPLTQVVVLQGKPKKRTFVVLSYVTASLHDAPILPL